jgi:hypothetical protein
MATVFHSEMAIPLWLLALGVVALNASTRAMALVIALVALAPIAFTMLRAVRRGPLTLDDALDARTLTPDDAVDLVRVDDDGGWQMASPAGPAASRHAE